MCWKHWHFMNTFKQRLFDTFSQECHGRLQGSSRARSYRIVKPQHQLSKYQQCDTYKSHRMVLSRFILSSYRLCVETGRWGRPEPIRLERTYMYYALRRNKIGDEYHMLFECWLYDEIRINTCFEILHTLAFHIWTNKTDQLGQYRERSQIL